MANRSIVARYGLAVGAAALAAAVNGVLWPELGTRYPLISFYPAILLTAWLAGLWPAVLCTACGAIIAAFLWIDPVVSIRVRHATDAVALGVFGLVGSVIAVVTDASVRQAKNEHVARLRAEEASRLKDEFLSTVSHELRTPLNAILGWTEMLRTGTLAPERRTRAVEAIHANAERQYQLIGDLLDSARITAGTLKIRPAAVDILDILRSAADVVEPAAQAKRIVVTVDGPHVACIADPTRLQQVFWNLLTNAVKFTHPGGEVRAELRSSGDVVEISVRDNGIGIRHGFLPFVFEPFRQADASTTRALGGLGLGLSIVKHLVEAHGGSIAAASDGEGCGSTFTVRLPATNGVPQDGAHLQAIS